MHGASKDLRNNEDLEIARSKCLIVLKEQIRILKPLIIIASGKHATNSLYDIGLIRLKWEDVRKSFSKGAYKESIKKWDNINHTITVICTYHTSAKVVNQTVSKMYDEKETEQYLQMKKSKLDKTISIDSFLKKYSERNATHLGMKYLLNHWLDIGIEIRSKYKEYIKHNLTSQKRT